MLCSAVSASSVVLYYILYFFPSSKSCLPYFGHFMVMIFFLYCIAHLVWSKYFELNFPMPFLGLFLHFPGFIGQVSGVWFLLPRDLLAQNDFRRKLKICFMYWLWWIFLNIQKDVLSFVFKILTGYWQSIIALMIPILREWNKRVLSKLLAKMGKKDDERANVWMSISSKV